VKQRLLQRKHLSEKIVARKGTPLILVFDKASGYMLFFPYRNEIIGGTSPFYGLALKTEQWTDRKSNQAA